MSAADVTAGGGTVETFTVTFSNNAVITREGLAGSVTVTGPGGFSQAAEVVSVDGFTATYSITPPGGSWNSADAGTYTASMEANKVGDGAGRFVPAGPLGSFNVAIPPEYPGATQDNAVGLPLTGKGKAVVRDALAPGTKADMFYGLSLAQPSKIRAKLAKLKGDVDFELRDAAGTVLATSANPGRKPEALTRVLPAGTYYVHLTLKGAAGTNYAMNVLVKQPSKKEMRGLSGS